MNIISKWLAARRAASKERKRNYLIEAIEQLRQGKDDRHCLEIAFRSGIIKKSEITHGWECRVKLIDEDGNYCLSFRTFIHEALIDALEQIHNINFPEAERLRSSDETDNS